MSFDEEHRDEHDECRHEIESLRAQLEAANAEVQEQARLNGMGAEREAKLRAQLEEFSAELEIAKGTAAALEREFDNHTATQANAARLVEALELMKRDKWHWEEIRDKALSTPINLDALHEDRARECERLADLAAGAAHDDAAYILRKQAAAHRAKKEGK